MSSSTTSASHFQSAWCGLSLGLILLLGLVLRGIGLNARSLWYDEAISASALQFSWVEVISRRASERSVHPPLYFLLLKMWASIFGASDAALRSLSMLLGVCGIAGVFLLGRELGLLGRSSECASNRIGLCGAFLMAVHPMQILTSQQVRGYALGATLSVWSSWVALRALRENGRSLRVHWCIWGILTTLFCYTSNLAVFSVVAHAAFAALYLWGASVFSATGRDRATAIPEEVSASNPGWPAPNVREQVSAAACGVAILVVAYGLPWLPRVVSQSNTVRTTQTIKRPFTLKQVPQEIHRAVVSSWAAKRSWKGIVIWPTTAFLGGLFLYLSVRGGWPGWCLLLTGVLPVVALVLFSIGSNRSIVHTRYMTFMQPTWLTAFAYAMFRHRWRLEHSIVAVWLLVVSIALYHGSWSEIGLSGNPGMRAAVHYARQRLEPGELVLARERHVFFGMQHYFGKASLPRLLVDRTARESIHAGIDVRDSDLVTLDEVLRQSPVGVWIFSTEAYNAPERVDFEVPACWELMSDKEFEQDYFWEGSVRVQHYRVKEEGG